MKKSTAAYKYELDKHLFKEIEYLYHFQNSEKEQDIKVMIQWIEQFTHYFNHSCFTSITMAHFFDVLHTIEEKHPKIKKELDLYFFDYPNISHALLEKSYELLMSAKIRELTHILAGVMISRRFTVPDEWMRRWFESSQNQLVSANYLDLSMIISVLFNEYKKPPQDWVDRWVIQCELHIFDFHQNPFSFLLILATIIRLSLNVQSSFKDLLFENSIIYMSQFSQSQAIFFMSRSFKLKEINHRKNGIRNWFICTEKIIRDEPEKYLKDICIAFANSQKLEDGAPQDWIDLCVQTFISYFKNLSVKDIGNCLYAMALMQIDPQKIMSFLIQCKNVINENFEVKLLENNTYTDISHFVISQYYFKKHNFDLGIKTEKLESFLKLNKRIRIINKSEEIVLDALKQFKELDVTAEYWIPEIADSVDFSIKTQKGLKLIEFDGPSHEINGKLSCLTKLKTYLLKSYGYDLLRIHYKDLEKINDILKDNILPADKP
ncbi:MAG: hypothetical protein C0425_11060 [Chlorobiaceae bacterium]|nr:hypothetical protein [Chlorobiaceae bacterium]